MEKEKTTAEEQESPSVPNFPNGTTQNDAEDPSSKKNPPSTAKIIIIVCSFAALVALAIIGLSFATNTYKTPIKTIEKYIHAEEYDPEDALYDYLNGFMVKELKKVLKVLHKSDYYTESMENIADRASIGYDSFCSKYGDDAKTVLTITDKTELTKSEIKEYRSNIQDEIDWFATIADYTEDFDSADWSELADELEITKSEGKAFVKAVCELAEKYEKIKITKGYELTVLSTTTGEELKEPLDDTCTYTVLKVNGRWICYSSFMNYVCNWFYYY